MSFRKLKIRESLFFGSRRDPSPVLLTEVQRLEGAWCSYREQGWRDVIKVGRKVLQRT